MNNYIYIISSIPFLDKGYKADNGSVMPVIEWIESQLGESDRQKARFVREGFEPEKLTGEFYRKAFKAKDGFTAAFFANDLTLRNAKVRYLNASLGRDKDMDIMTIEGAPQVSSYAAAEKIFEGGNLLEREKAMDDFLWNAADDITRMMNFKLANILAIIAKLCIIERWLALDEDKGRELLTRMVNGIRGSYGTINFEQFR